MVSLDSPFFCFHYDKLPCSVVLHHQALIKLPYNGIKSFFKSQSNSGLKILCSFRRYFRINLFGNTNVKATSKRLMCHFLSVYCVLSLVLRHFFVRKPYAFISKHIQLYQAAIFLLTTFLLLSGVLKSCIVSLGLNISYTGIACKTLEFQT